MNTGRAASESRTAARRSAGSLPPGPSMPAAVQTALLVREPIGFLERCRRRYGPVFRLRIIGLPRFVYVAEPDLARAVFATDRDVGRAGAIRRDFLSPLVGESSVLTLEGDEWLRHRKLLGPAFHGRRIAGYREEIAAIAAREVERWPRREPFELRDRMQAITLEVILRLVFGIRDAERLDRLRGLLPELLEAGGSYTLWAIPPPLRARVERSPLMRLPGFPLRRFIRLRAEVDSILLEQIARRRAQGTAADGEDVLSLLVDESDEEGRRLGERELRDELVTLLFAGHETTATALAWAFERLLRAPHALERLTAELSRGEEEYLDAVVKETLRSRPVVFDTPRLLVGPLELGGHRIPAGFTVAPAIPLVHRAPHAFPDPDAFRPERFLGDDPPHGSWIPFGGGRRRCLGSHLALLELRTVIGEVLRRVELHAPDSEPESPRLRHVTLVPSRRTRVMARRAGASARAP